MKKLWGDNFYSVKKKGFKTDADEDGKTLPRCFVQFIMRPIIQLCRAIFDDNLDTVTKMLETLKIELKPEEKTLVQKPLFKCIFQKWINAAEALLEMIIMKLPSPKKA